MSEVLINPPEAPALGALSRRQLIGGAVAVGAAVAMRPVVSQSVAVLRGSASPATRTRLDLGAVNFAAFEQFIGDRFVLLAAPLGLGALVLHQVRRPRVQPSGGVGDASHNFSVLFSAPLAHPLQQDVYQLQHRSLGAMDLLLVPMQPDANSHYLEAVFNSANPR